MKTCVNHDACKAQPGCDPACNLPRVASQGAVRTPEAWCLCHAQLLIYAVGETYMRFLPSSTLDFYSGPWLCPGLCPGQHPPWGFWQWSYSCISPPYSGELVLADTSPLPGVPIPDVLSLATNVFTVDRNRFGVFRAANLSLYLVRSGGCWTFPASPVQL